MEHLLGPTVDRKKHIQPGYRPSNGRDADTEPLSESHRIDQEGLDGQEYQEVQKRYGEGK